MLVLALGTNLGDRVSNLTNAVTGLKELFTGTIHSAPLYESKALLLPGSPTSWDINFLNTTISGDCQLTPQEVLKFVKELEVKLGRDNKEKWSPRIIDIDLICYDNHQIESAELTLPHPEIGKRPFVIFPLTALIAKNNQTKKWFDKVSTWGSRYSDSKEQFNKYEICLADSKIQAEYEAKLKTVEVTIQSEHWPNLYTIINATPDSFSADGLLNSNISIEEYLNNLTKQGVRIIDIGAESTRPGALCINYKEECQRLDPFFKALAKFNFQVSLDSRNLDCIKYIIDRYKVDTINDVSSNLQVAEYAYLQKKSYIAMHNLGIPADRQKVLPSDSSVLGMLINWSNQQVCALKEIGFNTSQIILDPGIGFGKTADQSWEIIRNINALLDCNLNWLIGHSRKSFLNSVTLEEFSDRDAQTAQITAWLSMQGVQNFRVHNFEKNISAIKIAERLAF